MTGKSESAFRTIGEVAESLDLPQHVLRFWETRFNEIEPVKRAGGRRYYRQRDVELVAAIRHLLYGQGYTIKGVQRLLKEQGVRAVIENARGAAGGLRPSEVTPPAVGQDDLSLPNEELAAGPGQDETIVIAEFLEVEEPPPPSGEDFKNPMGATSLVAFAPRQPTTLTLPAIRISDSPVTGLRKEDADRLREALDDLAECKRMLEVTRRWRD